MPDAPAPDEPSPQLSDAEERFERRRRTAGLFVGPLAFLVLLAVPPAALSPAAGRLLAIVAWVLVWWITEAVPIPLTAVLGPALTVVLRVTPAKEAFAPFGDPIIFLFLGSFLLAEAMAVHGLDRRLAGAVLSVPAASRSPRRLVLSFAGLAAALSMWLSNSATTAMLYPIALGVLARRAPGPEGRKLSAAVLLACAYGASVGGIGTPVGTPPNLVVIGQLQTLIGLKVGFVPWLLLALPILLAMLGASALVLSFGLPRRFPEAGAGPAALAPGAWSRGERNVAMAFAATVCLWVGPGIAALVLGDESPVAASLARSLPEGAVALLGASLLFVLPADWKARRFTLSWSDAERIDWGTLLLFGGGLSLGAAMFRTGLSEALGKGLTGATGVSSTLGLTVVFSVFAIFFTEVTSNTAAATMLVPLAVATATASGASPLQPALGCAFGCSMAFMLPVATPPNAIVYGSGHVRIGEMARAGLFMNAAACLVIPPGVMLHARLVLR